MGHLRSRIRSAPASRQRPLERYMVALEKIAAANTSGLALTELAQCCQLPAATTYRILQGLLDANLIMVRPGRSKEYVVGPRLFRLLHAGIGDGWLQMAAQPVLDQLVEVLNETCFVTQLVGKKVISIAWTVPESGLTKKVYPGDVMPPHAAASAKAILAYQSDAFVPHILGTRERFTQRTKTELARIKEEYVRVRRDGFAMCWGEMDEGLGAIACPIAVEGLGVQYAVAVTGVTKRLERRPITEVVALLKRAAVELGHSIENGSGEAGMPNRLRPRQARAMSRGDASPRKRPADRRIQSRQVRA
jgi:DNA-binding IclR family transcriptional regulator